MSRAPIFLGIATADAQVIIIKASLTAFQVTGLTQLLRGLSGLGHVAAFAITQASGARSHDQLLDQLRDVFGGFVVDAVLAAPAGCEPPPAYLVPVWPFDHSVSGLPASTARFQALELEVRATPCADDERGATLRGWPGTWLLEAHPL